MKDGSGLFFSLVCCDVFIEPGEDESDWFDMLA
jgi:hypothetical protein